MSQTYIPGIVDNIRSDSTPYMPIIEAVTNAIDAIEKKGAKDGHIDIYLERENTMSAGLGEPNTGNVVSIKIEDNGVGFDDENRESFDTVYSPQKKSSGGKGFGRFFYLRHFRDVHVTSVYSDSKNFKERSFDFGKQYDVVINEEVKESRISQTGSTIELIGIQRGSYDKDLEMFAHRVLEQLLSYFADSDYECPTITIYDDDGSKIILNDLIGQDEDSLIQIKKIGKFTINGEDFTYKMFKILKPRNQKSRIFLTARNQVVPKFSPLLEQYVPEFASEFTETILVDGKQFERNYIVRFYVQGAYLEANVTTERDSFNFAKEPDPLYPVSGYDIDAKIAEIARSEFKDDVTVRFAKKKERVEQYAEENVWYKAYVEDVDFDKLKINQSKIEIEETLHRVKYQKDLETKRQIAQITSGQKSYSEAIENSEKLIQQVKDTSISDLAQYMAFRKSILELFKKTVELTENGTYKDERAVHDLIFPTKTDSDSVSYEGHNLWILDEGLNFTQYISSDKTIFKNPNKDRPDIAAFHYRVAYREANEAYSPISIFEFKKPGRNDFVNDSSKENPFEQIKRYVAAIQERKLKTIKGVEIQIAENTPFYGYIVADVDSKIRAWLKVQDFKPMPDGQGWFYRHEGLNLYVEYVTWAKLIKDAEIRHRKFFELLGVV